MRRRDILRDGLRLGAASAIAGVLPRQSNAQAADFPNRPITLIVPWPAGGGTDIWHRSLAEVMSRHLGQPVVVDNKAGASGTLGPATMAAAAKPDGYTIAHVPITILRLPAMQKVAWEPMKDFTWIVHISGFLFATIVRADSPYKTFKDLIDYARANPGKVTYGTPGAGTSLHIGMELIAKHAGIKWTQVPFKGTMESLAAIAGNHVTCLAGGSDWWPLYDAGQVRPLVMWTEKRNERVPDIPTLQEEGFPFVLDSPFGIAGPRGMDAAIVKKLHDAIKIALEDPKAIEVRKRYDLQDRYMGTAAYAAYQVKLFEQEKKYLADIGLAKKE